jgi:hypothetical protein
MPISSKLSGPLGICWIIRSFMLRIALLRTLPRVFVKNMWNVFYMFSRFKCVCPRPTRDVFNLCVVRPSLSSDSAYAVCHYSYGVSQSVTLTSLPHCLRNFVTNSCSRFIPFAGGLFLLISSYARLTTLKLVPLLEPLLYERKDVFR